MLTIAMIFNAGFGVFHLLFWWLFDWPASLGPSGSVNSGITQVLNLCLTFIFFAATFTLGAAAVSGGSGAPVLLAGGVFWAFRAVLQPIYFPIRHRLSLALLALFVLGSVVHWLAYFRV